MNNIMHLRYAVEIEKTGSISKAAQNMYMAQPHLSKAIRELEDSLGIKIFNRQSKGVTPTNKGKEFLNYAKQILSQIDEMEMLYKPHNDENQVFDISVPRASYISHAFIEFVKVLDLDKNIKLNYRETNSMRAIKNVADSTNNIAIVRYQEEYEKFYLNAIAEREMKYESIWSFQYRALMSKKHPLAKKSKIEFKELAKYTEIIHGDLSVPALPVAEAKKIQQTNLKKKYIAVYERGSQFELLSQVPSTYIWVSPMPKDVMKCFSLVQKPCSFSKNKFKDILIYRNNYHLTELDNTFIKELYNSVQQITA